jgi:uncharacterized membrane protein YcaP (DUF421 family)
MREILMGPAGTVHWDVVLRTAAIYFFILLALRLAGKREIGQMTVFDFVLLLLISNAVQNAMVGKDNSLLGGILAALTLVVLNVLLSRARERWPRLGRMFEGTPTVLVLHGEPVEKNLQRERVDKDLLEQAVREHGVADLSGVELAVLEMDGSISVVPTGGTTHRLKRRAKALRRP